MCYICILVLRHKPPLAARSIVGGGVDLRLLSSPLEQKRLGGTWRNVVVFSHSPLPHLILHTNSLG